ncbi:MAG TPA: hypothetical protein VHE34_09160 [Puia sp.]|uniref:hypothetical protein n=1 Tax=Puia sp. TaxID=2045100 RepID=UPI002CC1BD37|nr:hypothetical protein [Puia sp.]HVU95381.1 hypothetical protein [Puia sp.]
MRKLLSLFFLSFCHTLFAQGDFGGALALPSPNNNFLGKNGTTASGASVGVDEYTGAARANIPLGALPSKGVTIPVSLTYTGGGGIHVQDYAGPAGLGWRLNAGGSVSRVVRAFPDEFSNGYIGTAQWGNILANWPYYSTGQAGSGQPGDLTSAQATQLKGINGNGTLTEPVADGEPDLFYVSTPAFSFQFVFDGNGHPVFSNSTGLQIIDNLYNNSSPGNTFFEVIDGQGNQYYFGSTPASREWTTTTLYGVSYTFPTTWYLDKIVLFNSQDVISLKYDSAAANDVLTHYQSSETEDQFGHFQTTTLNQARTVIHPKVVTSIVSALGEFDFSYAYDRTDDPSAARLAAIVRKGYDPHAGTNSTTLQTVNFRYGYFNASSGDPNQLRLRLDLIYMTDNNIADPPIVYESFDYNTTANLPARNSGAFDFWGFATATCSSDPLANYATCRQPNAAMAVAGVLTAVHEMTGGSWNFSYGLNDYYNGSATVAIGGLRVNQLSHTMPTGESLATVYTYTDPVSGQSSGQILSTLYNQLYFGLGTSALFYSESPYIVQDVNGNFSGYSYVKQQFPNGSYSISHYYNFNDPGFGDVLNETSPDGSGAPPSFVSATSAAYKRGLLRDRTLYMAGSPVTKVSSVTNTYIGLTSPVTAKSLAYRPMNLQSAAGGIFYGSGEYNTPVENYVPSTSVRAVYDANDQNSFTQETTTYTYAADQRLIKTITTTDSRGLSRTETRYYGEDAGTLGLSQQELSTVNSMMTAGYTDVLVEDATNRNGTQLQTNYNYQGYAYGATTNYYLTGTTDYFNSAQTRQKQYLYDAASSHQVSAEQVGSKPASVQFGYNGAYPVARVVNATNTVSYVSGTGLGSNTFTWNPGVFNSQNGSFTQLFTSNITLSGGFSEFPGTDTYTFNYTLQGPVNTSGTLCINGSAGGCSFPPSATLPNMPPGQYTLTIFPNSDFSIGTSFTYTWQASNLTDGGAKEFFYEGFEENPQGSSGTAHTGNYYYNGNYAVNFSLPNSRNYVIQWWSLAGGAWSFHEQAYTGPTTLTGPVDDVRIFPSDAQMTSYTYQPMVGMTSETDPAGRSTYYEYDGYGRPSLTRDLNGNILKSLSYSYAGATVTKPIILGTTFGAPVHGIYLYFIPTSVCGSIVVSWTNTAGHSGNQSSGCGGPVVLTLPDAFQTYTITVTCYPPGPPTSSASSDPIQVYMPF